MTEEQINEVMRLVRDAVLSSALFATGQIADMSIVGEAKCALVSYLRTIGEPESVNAELLEALKDARHCIGIDRDTLVDCHTNPCTGYLDPDGALAKAEYDDVIDAADAAIARAESAIETPAKVSPCAGHAVQQDADEVISLAQALEQHRARKIVDAVSALRKDIQTVMETQGARMTYHIANCLRYDFGKVLEGWYNGTLDTSTVRRELERMEKDGLVHRIPSSYSRQICWQKGGKA